MPGSRRTAIVLAVGEAADAQLSSIARTADLDVGRDAQVVAVLDGIVGRQRLVEEQAGFAFALLLSMPVRR
jgi:hypothetical protein